MLHFQNISVRHLADGNLVVECVNLWEEKNMQLGPMGAGGSRRGHFLELSLSAP